jgi:putative transposase
MPRPLRHAPGGFVYHVLNRANDRQLIFENQAQYEEFHDLLADGTRRTPMRVCGYCVMPNHWHLLLWPAEDGALSAYLHWVTARHSMQRRRRAATTGHGHVYQGRFKSFPVETARYYYNALKYVESNPLRAGLVSRAEEWRWSSLFERAHSKDVIVDGPLPLPDSWVAIVNSGLRKTELETLRTSVGKNRPYGSTVWSNETASALGLDQTFHHRGRPRKG